MFSLKRKVTAPPQKPAKAKAEVEQLVKELLRLQTQETGIWPADYFSRPITVPVSSRRKD